MFTFELDVDLADVYIFDMICSCFVVRRLLANNYVVIFTSQSQTIQDGMGKKCRLIGTNLLFESNISGSFDVFSIISSLLMLVSVWLVVNSLSLSWKSSSVSLVKPKQSRWKFGFRLRSNYNWPIKLQAHLQDWQAFEHGANVQGIFFFVAVHHFCFVSTSKFLHLAFQSMLNYETHLD